MSPAKDPADYPFFTGGVSRLVWRIYTQRLTVAGRWFALATFGFISYSGASLQLQGFVPAAYAVGVWFVALLAFMFLRPRARVVVRMPERVTVGATVHTDLVVTNLSSWRGHDLVLIPHRLPRTIDCVPEDGVVLSDLARGQSTRAGIGLVCRQRGVFDLRGFRVESTFPFGLLRARRMAAEPRRLTVHPEYRPLTRLLMPGSRRHQPGGVELASEIGESLEYLGNREFRAGDNVRDIDWRATARVAPGANPVVREWVEEYMLRVGVVLDTHIPRSLGRNDLAARRADFERAVSLAASVANHMSVQDYLVDLFAAGPDLYHLTAGRSLAYLEQILDILACVNESRDGGLDVVAPRLAELLGRISTVILILLDLDEPRRAFVDQIVAQGVSVKVIVVRDGAPALEPGLAPPAWGPVRHVTAEEFKLGVDHV
jgi:uncharacterized protein (DUF58 family)